MKADARELLAGILPDGDAFLAASERPFRRALRRHPRRGELRGWRALAPVPWSPWGSFHAAEQDPGAMLDWHTGAAYAQDAASQLPAVVLAPRPGEVIVDCCAAPGSKASQLGLLLEDEGLLVCCDRSAPRRAQLVEVLERQGITTAVVTPVAPELLAARHPGAADAVLVDAPCSGATACSLRQAQALARRQVQLLRQCCALVRPGGRLVYSTCTALPVQDEEVVAQALERLPEWTIERLAISGTDPDLHGLGAVRLWPQRQGTEPFFVCRLRRRGNEPARGFPGQLPSTRASLAPWLPATSVCAWRSGAHLLMASPAAASCALPSQARGCRVAREDRLTPWGAQALIERGAAALAITHDQALAAFAGRALGLAPGTLLRTDAGGPVGVVGRDGRLDLPSRQVRDGLS